MLSTRAVYYKYISNRCYSASKMSSSLLIENSKYSWLKDLDLSSENKGVFWGEWGGSGSVSAACQPVKIFSIHTKR